MAETLTFKVHGPGAEPVKVTITPTEKATEQHWLETFAGWMRTGEIRDLPTARDGECRVNFSQVWAVEYVPPPPPPVVY